MTVADISDARAVSARLVISVTAPTDLVLLLAVADLPAGTEELSVTLDGAPIIADEIDTGGPGRAHRLTADPGHLVVNYQATITENTTTSSVTPAEEIIYLRPSRYVESDLLAPIATDLFAGINDTRQLARAVTSWVNTHLVYVSGSSRPTDGAVQTLLRREGVCRDYAHLTAAFLRALDIPARLTAVYAPGLAPMDFHAVTEAAIDGTWHVLDATALAPRSTLVRIGSGRDAADTAFLSNYRGKAELVDVEVTAITHGPLPPENMEDLQTIR